MRFSFGIFFFLIFSASISQAQNLELSVPWSTTFGGANCTASSITVNVTWANTASPQCDSLPGRFQGSNHSGNGNFSIIDPVANFPGGGGGKGYRKYNYPHVRNSESSPLDIEFCWVGVGTCQSEIWVRAYVRYQAGYALEDDDVLLVHPNQTGGHKMIYTRDTSGNANAYIAFEYNYIFWSNGSTNIQQNGWGDWNFWNPSGATTCPGTANPTACSDGSWQCLEFHIKASSTNVAADGQADVWVNGTQRFHSTVVPWGVTTFQGFVVPSNTSGTDGNQGSGDLYEDWDDYAVSNTGQIGCPYSTGGGGGSTGGALSVRGARMKGLRGR